MGWLVGDGAELTRRARPGTVPAATREVSPDFGVGLGVALAEALTRSQHATVSIPAGQLLIYILATGAAGVLVSIGPARRAAKLNMLTAIAAE
jgi:hypothetical protein